MRRIVVDTNVFIAALLSAVGDNRRVIRACLMQMVVPLMSTTLLCEFEDVLGRSELMLKCPLPAKDREALLDAFLSVSEWVNIHYLWRPNLPDEGDNHLMELAVAGNANVIVTNNIRDLTRGELIFPNIQILTPKQFLEGLPWPS